MPPCQQKIIFYGSRYIDEKLARELEISMGDFTKANIWSLRNLIGIVIQRNKELFNIK